MRKILWVLPLVWSGVAFAQVPPTAFGPASPGGSGGLSPTGNASATTTTATNGLTARTNAAWWGDTVNALGQGVTGNGGTDDAATLLTAAGLAQSGGSRLFVPTPTSSYLLNSDWKPATGDLAVYISPGVTFTGAGLPKFDNQFVHMVNPIFAPVLESRTFGAAYAGYGNILLHADVAINNGAGNTVAGYFEGVSNLATTHSWGTNPVCITLTAGGTCIGEEIDTWADVAGTNAYGLAIFMTGHADGLNAIQVGANSTSSRWLNGIDFVGANDATTSITGSVITSSANISAQFGLNLLNTATSAEVNTLSFRVAATVSSPTSRIQISGGSASANPKITVIPSQGGSAGNSLLEIATQGTGGILLENGDGRFLQLRDPAGTIANYAYVQAATTTNQVVIGCDTVGPDTDVTCDLRTKGAGGWLIQNDNGIGLQVLMASASTVSRLVVNGAAAGGNVTLSVGGTATNLNINSGASNLIKFGGAGSWSANGAVATTMTSLGPTGSHTTIQEWFTVVDSGGTTRYIPAY